MLYRLQAAHSRTHLFWRSLVAGGYATSIWAGLYPGLYHARLALRGPKHPVLRAAIGEWLSAVVMTASRPVGFWGLPGQRGAGNRPVVLVHGLFMNRANYLLMASRLRAAGVGPIYGFEYWTLAPMRKNAQKLDRFLKRVVERHGCDVDLVGHSLGGVLGSYYVKRFAGQGVRKFVTIGAPYGGAAVPGNPPKNSSLYDIRKNSEFMEELHHLSWPDSVEVTNVWSVADALVLADQVRLNHGREIRFDDLGHLSLLISRRVTRHIAERLLAP